MKRIATLFLLFVTLQLSFVIGRANATPPAPIPQTGQTSCWDTAGNVIACTGTGQDGDKKPGVAWPSPRFTDNANGTVTDNLTGLIWLKNANCTDTVGGKTPSSGLPWADAITWSNNLASGKCSLTDGSTAGQWRLPSRRELLSLVDSSRSNPALPSGHPFTNVQANYYWSSSTYAVSTTGAWNVSMDVGYVNTFNKSNIYYVWPVRGGK